MNQSRTPTKISAACLFAAAMWTLAPDVRANSYTFDFETVFSGATPAGAIPWAESTFTDSGSGAVTLTVTASGFYAGESLTKELFVLAPGLNPTELRFTPTEASGSFTLPMITESQAGYTEASQSGLNVELTFSSTTADEFAAGDYLQYTISGVPNLTASDFESLDSTSDSGVGPFYGVAEISGIGSGKSTGWVGASNCNTIITSPTPEPVAAAILPVGIGLWAAVRRLRNRKP
jgi:hypothetical protein